MATHSSILAWEIPWPEDPGRLRSMSSQTQLRTKQQQILSVLLSKQAAFCVSGSLNCAFCLGSCVLLEKTPVLPVLFCSMCVTCLFSSVQFSRSVVSDSLRPQEPQHARPPCPSPTPGVHSDSRPSESVTPSSHFILCRPLLLLPPIPPSISLFQ